METEIKKPVKINDLGKDTKQLVEIDPQELVPLPPPYDKLDDIPKLKELTEDQLQRLDTSLDGFVLVGAPKPANEEEEKEWVEKFLNGLRKLLDKEDNWTFLKPLIVSLEYCAKCQTCSSTSRRHWKGMLVGQDKNSGHLVCTCGPHGCLRTMIMV